MINNGAELRDKGMKKALDCSVYLAGHLIEIQEKLKLPESQCTGDECI